MADLEPHLLSLLDDAVDTILLARVVAGDLGFGAPPAALDAALRQSAEYQVALTSLNNDLRIVRDRLGDDRLLLTLEGAITAALVASSDVGFSVAMVHWGIEAERR